MRGYKPAEAAGAAADAMRGYKPAAAAAVYKRITAQVYT